ncbi:TetR/AcrR family transcriptional regulator [Plantactinospora sp. DSM 117369]
MDRYHHGDLRAALVEAGMEMARGKGSSALGIRELARVVGVSPNAAYRHFTNLRALVLTVAQEARRRLSRAILDRMNATPSGADLTERSLAHLRAFALGYIHFARSEPGWFALTCESQEPPPDAETDTSTDAPPSPHELLLNALDAMLEARLISPERRVNAEWSCWSTTHGFAIMATNGPLQAVDPDTIARLADQAIDTLIRGLQA